MTRKKIIQSLAAALLMFSGVSIKAERIITNEQKWRLERIFNYSFCGTAAYFVTQVATTYLSEKIGYKIPENVKNALASLAHFCAQTAVSELRINPSYPESSITGKKRFLGNIASTVGVFSAIHFKLFGLQDETMGICLTGLLSGISGEKLCSHMNVVLEKNYEKKKNSIEQLQKIIEEKKVSN